MKKKVSSAYPLLAMLLLVSMIMSHAGVAQAQQTLPDSPLYTGIYQLSSSLSISSSGRAICEGCLVLKSGYTADLKVELKRNGVTIKTWTASGSGTFSAGGIWYVLSGYGYFVTTTATVYDSNGQIVESPSKNSLLSIY